VPGLAVLIRAGDLFPFRYPGRQPKGFSGFKGLELQGRNYPVPVLFEKMQVLRYTLFRLWYQHDHLSFK
jgi:hypothetical protein